jgi:hypothetical protein
VSADRAAALSQVVTFLFTDIEGSTRRWEADARSPRPPTATSWNGGLGRNAVDFVESLATALTPIAFFETFMVKSYETLVDSDTRVDVNTGIVAASRLQAVIGSRDYSIDIAEMVARIPRRRARCARAARLACVR